MGNQEDGDEAARRNQELVDKLLREGNLTDARVEAAFRAVPRHLFLPALSLEDAYRDDAIPTKRLPGGQVVSSSSQPTIMAIMLEQLAVEPGQRILEIGAGTGYNAALLAHLVGDTGQVYTIDIDEDIVAAARAHLRAAGFERVQALLGDGAEGYADGAPYDRIILTVAAWDITPAWRMQLKVGGRLGLPLDIKGSQRCLALYAEDDYLVSLSARPCGFMGLRGSFAAPRTELTLGPDGRLHLFADQLPNQSSDDLYALVKGSFQDIRTEITLTAYDIYGSLSLWLALHEAGYCFLIGEGDAAQLVPPLLSERREYHTSLGLLSDDGLALLMRGDSGDTFTVTLRYWRYDHATTEGSVVNRLLARLEEWHAEGRPDTDQLQLRIYPRDHAYQPQVGEISLNKHWSKLIIRWKAGELS